MSARNSKRRNISWSSERSGGASTSSAGSQSMSRSRRIVASTFDSRAWSACSRSDFARAGDSSSTCSSTPSTESNCWMSCAAVLSPMPGHAGDRVGRVALEADEVGHLLGRHAETRGDALGRIDVDVGDAARRHHQADVVRDELKRVAVGRDDARGHARLVGPSRQRGDDVVRLPTFELEVAVAERLHDRLEIRELLPQQVGHRAAVRLVLAGDGRAVHGLRVPGHRDPSRAVVREQLDEHVREAEQRVRGEAVARHELLGQGEIRPVREVVAVDEEEIRLARRRVVEVELLARDRLRAHAFESSVRGCASRSSPERSSSSSTHPTTPSCSCLPSPRARRSPTSARRCATPFASRSPGCRWPAWSRGADGRRS